MTYVRIDEETVVMGFIDSCVSKIGSDPDGWDHVSNASEHSEFMRVCNHELSIDRLPGKAATSGDNR